MKIILIGDYLGKLMSAALAVALFFISIGVGSAEVIYVEPGDSIQAAVNNSTSGDFIVVKAGDYRENLIVNVSGITVISEPENSGGVRIRARDKNSSVFHLIADNVTIKGFNIIGSAEIFSTLEESDLKGPYDSGNYSTDSGNYSTDSGNYSTDSGNYSTDYGNNSSKPESEEAYNSGSEKSISGWDGSSCPQAGFCLEKANNCTIEGNSIFDNKYGVYLQSSMNSTISNNTFFRNGIWLDEGCSKVLLINNKIEEGGISIGAHCWENIVFQNMLSKGKGISIACCGGNNLVLRNEIINCSTGVDIYDVQARTFLRDNRITNCDYGIYLIFVFDSRVDNNTISNCSTGIYLREDCHNNELANNTVASSNESGIYLLDASSENRIYNNYFNNTVNAKVEKTEGNIWNATKTSGTNVVEGPYLGGNFWANLNGTGFSQITNDTDSDGICDLPYNINGSDFDYLPLSTPPVAVRVEPTVTIGPHEENEKAEASIELDKSTLDFGTLLSGESGNSQVLSIRNTGKSDVNISVEVKNSSDPIFSRAYTFLLFSGQATLRQF